LSKTVAGIALVLTLLCAAGVYAGDSFESIDTWRSWKSIEAAIALAPLDGPEDIREKAEIIADRLDELKREETRLTQESEQNAQMVRSLHNQREILRNLAELQQGRGAQDPQQLHELTERIQQQEQLLKRRKKSLNDLRGETDRLQRLLEEYKQKAASLQQKESIVP